MLFASVSNTTKRASGVSSAPPLMPKPCIAPL
jgi:hypothetical protein